MNLPLPMSAMLALAMPMTTTLSGTLTFNISPLRALTVSVLPSTCSSLPRMRVSVCASSAVDGGITAIAAMERIMGGSPLEYGSLTCACRRYSATLRAVDPKVDLYGTPRHEQRLRRLERRHRQRHAGQALLP